MSVETVLMDFQVVPCLDQKIYVRDVATIATCVAETLRQDCLEQGCISSAFSYSAIYSGPKDCMFTIKHYFREGLITVALEYFKINNSDSLLYNYHEIASLEKLIRITLDADSSNSLPAIRRCLPRSPYLRSSDDRLLEYRWEALLFSERSPYQLVEIFQTKDYGAALVLDGYINLAESDLAYTRGLMCHGVESYKDKQVLILGGGDGALLHELLAEDAAPKHVTMVDIDEAVIRGCREHMRSVCGDVLDTLKTDKYEIIVDDAFKYLRKYREEEKKFDIIFGDLTDIPVHGRDTQTWAFVRAVIRGALMLLPVGGKYLTHCNGKCAVNSLAMFEDLIGGIGVPVEIATTEHFVPSFQEKWVFYQLTRLEGDIVEETKETVPVNGTATTEEAVVNGNSEEIEKSGDAKDVKDKEKGENDEAAEDVKDKKAEPTKSEKKEETKKDEGKKEESKKEEPKKEDSKKDALKKDDKKSLKGSKENLSSPKDKVNGLTKEKSNVDKKAKKAK